MEHLEADQDRVPNLVEPAQSGDSPSKPIPLQYGMAAPRFVIPIQVTIAVVALAIVFAAYICALFRTMAWGFSVWGFLVILLFALVFVAPFVLVASIGRRVRTMLICFAIIALVPPIFAEVWAGMQERDFVLRARLTPGVPMNEARWWPFGTSGIGTDGKIFYGYD